MDTVTIPKKEYRELKQARDRLGKLLNVTIKRYPPSRKRESFTDLVGALSDVKEFKGKSSVEVQHMIPELWSRRKRSS